MPKLDSSLIASWTGGRWLSAPPASLRGVSIDTRSLHPGDLFVAISGARFDGHDFIAQAFAQQAAAAVVERDAVSSCSGPILRVDHTLQALQDMAAAYRQTHKAQIIAVTGSLGKTTVKEMVADTLAMRLSTARTCGNLNNHLGVPLSLLNMEGSAQVGVFEAGTSQAGELAPLCRILAPDWGLITTLAPAHLEFFGSLEEIAAEKATLLSSLSAAGTAVLRGDDPCYERLRAAVPGRVITIAVRGPADYQGWPARVWGGPVEVLERSSEQRCQLQLPLPGEHQVVNALYAVAVGRSYGLSWDEIRSALENYRPPPMRWECRQQAGITIINDAYNANPESMAAALRTFAAMPVRGRRWLVLADMRELGALAAEAHAKLGQLAAQMSCEGLLVLGEWSEIIKQAAMQAGLDARRIFRCPDHAAAAERLVQVTQPGDAVLLKASRSQCLEKVLIYWQELLSKE